MSSHTLFSSIRGRAEKSCSDLREFASPPTTYLKYLKLPDGKEIYVGEFPTPTADDLRMGFNNSRRK